MNIPDKMLKAYFHVAEDLQFNPDMERSATCFHRTSKVAFFVEARKLGPDGLLDDERKFQVKEGK